MLKACRIANPPKFFRLRFQFIFSEMTPHIPIKPSDIFHDDSFCMLSFVYDVVTSRIVNSKLTITYLTLSTR